MTHLDRIVMWTVRLMLLAALGAVAGALLGQLPLDTATTVAAVILGGGSVVVVALVFIAAGLKDLFDAIPTGPAEASRLDEWDRVRRTYSPIREEAAVAGKRRH